MRDLRSSRVSRRLSQRRKSIRKENCCGLNGFDRLALDSFRKFRTSNFSPLSKKRSIFENILLVMILKTDCVLRTENSDNANQIGLVNM